MSCGAGWVTPYDRGRLESRKRPRRWHPGWVRVA